jgi:SAM-dependent methyltransferase
MEDHYKFSRNAAESDRSVLARYSNHLASLIGTSLRIQHKWMLAITGGFHIHPSIPVTLDTPNLRIADVGTGTGIYLIDLASMLPASAQLHGFDISTAQFPPPEKLPKNVSLHQQDMRFPFKEEFIGTFDIVDVRLTFLGIRGDEWIEAVKNVTALLSESICDTYPISVFSFMTRIWGIF